MDSSSIISQKNILLEIKLAKSITFLLIHSLEAKTSFSIRRASCTGYLEDTQLIQKIRFSITINLLAELCDITNQELQDRIIKIFYRYYTSKALHQALQSTSHLSTILHRNHILSGGEFTHCTIDCKNIESCAFRKHPSGNYTFYKTAEQT